MDRPNQINKNQILKVMLKRIFFLFVLCSMITASGISQDNQFFGEKISENKAISYEKLLKKMKKRDSLQVKVVANVEAVCQMKGCWMTIVSKDEEKPSMMVKFKDYGFFVPMDIAGRKVIMQGYAYKEETSVKELKHYAEDAGKSKEEIDAITEPKEEFKFMAEGVILLEE